METKNLFSRFLDNGGTVEEFWAGRVAALQQAKTRSEKHEKAARAVRKERILQLMDKGYSKAEAEEFLRQEKFEALESAGLVRLHTKVKKSRIPRIGLVEMEEKSLRSVVLD